MVETAPVTVPFKADDRDFNAKMDNLDRRIRSAEEKAKRSGSTAGSAFIGGIAGGVSGFVASSFAQSAPINAVTDLLSNTLAAALLPLITSLLPLIKKLTEGGVEAADWLSQHPNDAKALGLAAAGAYAGGKIGGPVGAAGGVVAAEGYGIYDLLTSEDAKNTAAQHQSYSSYIKDKNAALPSKHWWEGPNSYSEEELRAAGYTDYDIWDRSVMGRPPNQVDLSKAPAQQPGRPYDPSYPPPNVAELYGPNVVNTG